MKMEPSLKYNQFYHFHKHMVGSGINEGGKYVPHIGNVYTYRSNLKKGAGHRFFRRQRGLGLASFFTSLISRAAPVLRNIGSHAVDVVSNIAKDAIKGENIKTAAIRNIKEAIPAALSSITKPTLTNANELSPPPTPPPSRELKRKSVISSPIIKRKIPRRPKTTYPALRRL
jgi:hypothetical protein